MRNIILSIWLCLGLSGVYGQKNVLLIMADDFNYWPNGYYPQMHTPHLDSLAAKGIMFTDAHCASPVCNPSRNALWSGYRPSTTQIWSNGNNPQGDYFRDVPGFEQVVSMNQYFTDQGFYTWGGGKLYHPGKMGNNRTDPDNWRKITTQNTGSSGGGGTAYAWSHPDATVSWNGGSFDLSTAGDVMLANEAASLIQNYATSPQKDQPFFIACGLFRPHLPWNCHEDFFNLFDPDTLDFPAGYLNGDLSDIVGANPTNEHNAIVGDNQWKEAIRAYLASCAFADYNLGIILNALESSPHKDSTIVVFVGDHGWHLGEKSRWRKFSVYDQGSRTAMIVYDPTAKGNGQRCEKVVSLQDIYPTLTHWVGLPKAGIEGRSLLPLLEDPTRSDWNHPIFISYAGKHIIKTNTWRFVSDGNKSQLYQVETDPYEFTNLYGDPQYALGVQTLQSQLNQMVARSAEIRDSLQNPTSTEFSPNPPQFVKGYDSTKKLLYLDLLYSGPFAKLEIVDLQGKIWFTQELIGERELAVQLPEVPAGVYLVNIHTEGQQYTKKLLIR